MTPHERVINSIERKKPDRPPLAYSGTAEVTSMLMDVFKTREYEDLLEKLGVDFRYVHPCYVGPKELIGLNWGAMEGKDVWGIVWKEVRTSYGAYYEIAKNPMGKLRDIEEIDSYKWPDPDWIDVTNLKSKIEILNQKERKAIVFFAGRIFSTAWGLRGFETFLADLILQPEIINILMEKVLEFYHEVAKRALEATDGLIDIVFSADDIGTQNGMMISPELWRKYVKPWTRKLIKPFKEMGYKTCYHSDGDLIDVMDDFIEIGLDIINPVQPKAKNTNPENLRKKFGGRITFFGGIDTQELLPFGTPEKIKKEVRRIIKILGEDGGYIVAPSNNIQPDTPLKNILAVYDVVKKYNYN